MFSKALFVLAAASSVAAQCTPQWFSDFGGGDFGHEARAAAVFDEDGAGPQEPALFVGGFFRSAGGELTGGIARWNGTDWSSVGGQFVGSVYDMLVFDVDGPGPQPSELYVAGSSSITLPGGVAARGVVRWNGSSWSTTTSGWASGASVNALCTHDPDGDGPGLPRLVAGGNTLVSGSRVGIWNGAAWSYMPGSAFVVESVASCDHDGPGPLPAVLYSGTVNFGAQRWTGTTWQSMTGLTNGSVYAMMPFDPDGSGPQHEALLVGISTGFNQQLGMIARWDGAAWTPMNAGVNTSGSVNSLALIDPDHGGPLAPTLWSGGWLETFGGWGIAEWNGSSWLPAGNLRSTVHDVIGWERSTGTAVVAVGSLTRANGAALSNIAVRTGSTWSSMNPPTWGANGLVLDLMRHDPDGGGPQPEEIYAGGGFTAIGGIAANGVAHYRQGQWEPLGTGLDGSVLDLQFFDEDGPGPLPEQLFATGGWNYTGTTPITRVARWNGVAWLPTAQIDTAYSLEVFDEDGPGPGLPALFAGGSFGPLTGDPRRAIVRWDNGAWVEVGGGVTGGGPHIPLVHDCVAVDLDGPGPGPSMLVIGGSFDAAGGIPAPNIAAWDGSSWRAIGPGLNNEVRALVAFDADGPGPDHARLIAAGRFTGNLVRWTGTEWQALDVQGQIEAMACTPPSHQHPTLVIAGYLTRAGSVFVDGVARWDGQTWSAMGQGTAENSLNSGGAVLIVGDDIDPEPTVYVGGRFETVGNNVVSINLARWGCEPTTACYANCDNSTVAPILNVADFTCFLQRYAAGDTYANCDNSTTPPTLNVADFTCFLQRYAAGCQ